MSYDNQLQNGPRSVASLPLHGTDRVVWGHVQCGVKKKSGVGVRYITVTTQIHLQG